MASWKSGAAVKVMGKVNAGKALTDAEYMMLKQVAGAERHPPKNLRPAEKCSENQAFAGYKARVEKERVAVPNRPMEGDMLLPFVAMREREAELQLAMGADPNQRCGWHGKFKMSFASDEPVGHLFADSQWTRNKELDRERLRGLKKQLKEERSRRRAVERTAAEIEQAQRLPTLRTEFAPSVSIAPDSTQRGKKIPLRRVRSEEPAPERPLPITTGGTGYETLDDPRSLYDLHPAAQAAARYAAKVARQAHEHSNFGTRLPQIPSASR